MNKDKQDQRCEPHSHRCAQHMHINFFLKIGVCVCTHVQIHVHVYIHTHIFKKDEKNDTSLEASLLQPRPLVTGLCDSSANLGRTGKRTQRIFQGKGVIVQ